MSKLNDMSYKLSITFILLGGLQLLSQGFDFNILNILTRNYKIDKFVYLIIGICTLYVIFFHYRKLYLSFLEETVMPPNIFENKTNKNNDKTFILKLEKGDEGKKVIYWSAKKDTDGKIVKDWKEAYDKYENSGIVDIVDGKADLTYSTPVQYKVGRFDRLLPRHLHYRILYEDGVLSKIHTINLN